MKGIDRSTWVRGAIIAAVLLVALIIWRLMAPDELPEGIVAGNGRIEAIEVDISAKSPGRIREILVDEGDVVKAGQVLARIDTDALMAQKQEAEAQLAQVQNAILIATNQVAQRQSERAASLAVTHQRAAELAVARKRLARSETLSREGATPVQERDDDRARVESAQAALEAAQAQLAAVDTAIATARAQVMNARSSVEAVQATIRRIAVEIRDGELRAPRNGRIQYRVAQPGEVVGGGGRVLNLVDLSDVYMTFFMPEAYAGRVALGSEVRVVLDAAPDFVIPAKVSFVSDVAQFTPKTVETASEREKLMFRVKARIDPELLRRNPRQVKTGLPGMAYLRVRDDAMWPANLALAQGK